ncbi:hypothetical protein RYX36_016181 [Vicia faba]
MECCYLGMGRGIVVQEKSDAVIPVPVGTVTTPPEGNTTFIDGTTWCVALAGVSQVDLQNALDWACGLGMADCKAIQKDGPCFQPHTQPAKHPPPISLHTVTQTTFPFNLLREFNLPSPSSPIHEIIL